MAHKLRSEATLVALLLFGLIATGCSPATSAADEPAEEVQVVPVATEDVIETGDAATTVEVAETPTVSPTVEATAEPGEITIDNTDWPGLADWDTAVAFDERTIDAMKFSDGDSRETSPVYTNAEEIWNEVAPPFRQTLLDNPAIRPADSPLWNRQDAYFTNAGIGPGWAQSQTNGAGAVRTMGATYVDGAGERYIVEVAVLIKETVNDDGSVTAEFLDASDPVVTAESEFTGFGLYSNHIREIHWLWTLDHMVITQ